VGDQWSSWIGAARPKTLTAAVVPVVVGSVLGVRLSANIGVRWEIAIAALLCAAAIQVGTNLFNDVIDFQKGADTEARRGPKRITQSGEATPAQVFRAALLSFAVALLLGGYLVWHGGTPILIIGLLSLVCGYAYTGGPYPLAYRGLGDLFVLIFFGIVAVTGMVFLYAGSWSAAGFVAGGQVGLLAVVLIAINNLRDRETDLKADKRTLAVRLGERGAKLEIVLALLVPFLIGAYWVATPYSWAMVLPLVLFPRAVRLAKEIWRGPVDERLNRHLAAAAGLHLGFGVLLALGIFLGAAPGGVRAAAAMAPTFLALA
jgi:1,4-dihydroxy-2-naphthoate octaprenyltransferase